MSGLSDFLSSFEENNSKDNEAKEKQGLVNNTKPTPNKENKKQEIVKGEINNIEKTIGETQNSKEETLKTEESREEESKRQRDNFLKIIRETGTKTEHFRAWIDTYEKGLASKKNNKVVNKIKNGRFRIDKDGNLELLPDFKTETLSIKDIFKSNWI